MTDKNQNNNIVTVQTSVQEMAKLNVRPTKSWHASLIALTEKLLQKITKMPINITSSKENIMLNASAIFWYQDRDCKKFVMLESNFADDDDVVIQFPFVACFTKDSISTVLENSIKDLFGKSFKKTLPIDCFASDRIASVPTIIITDENNDDKQTVLHNMVWVNQIMPEQFELIQSHSDKFKVISLEEHEIVESKVHEIHKFLYQSCLRHIHQMKFEDISQMKSSFDELLSMSEAHHKTLH